MKIKTNPNRGDIAKLIRGIRYLEGSLNHELQQEYFDKERIDKIFKKLNEFIWSLDKKWSHQEYGCSWKDYGDQCLCNGQEWGPMEKEWS